MTYSDLDGWFNYESMYDYAVGHVPDGGTMVEVGCWMGKSAAYLAKRIKESGKKIKLICVETGFGSLGNDADIHRVVVEQCGGNFAGKLVKNLADCGVLDTCYPLIVPSVQAAGLFADNSIDFTFIDGDHREEAVRSDLHAWYPKIKSGGLFAGHDYNDWPSVTKAVNDFFGHECSTRLSPVCWLIQKSTGGSPQG